MITLEDVTATVPFGNPEQGYTLATYTEFHYGNCTRTVGPRGGVALKTETWRRSGQTKTWKREPTRFRVPIKYGLRCSSYLTEENAHLFHLPKDCPLNANAEGSN